MNLNTYLIKIIELLKNILELLKTISPDSKIQLVADIDILKEINKKRKEK